MSRSFFCENCGKPVDQRAEVCRHCGSIFVAVKCPRCGFRGKQHEFQGGCPRCGYLSQARRTVADHGGASEKPGRDRHAKARPIGPDQLFWLILIVMLVAFGVLATVYARL